MKLPTHTHITKNAIVMASVLCVFTSLMPKFTHANPLSDEPVFYRYLKFLKYTNRKSGVLSQIMKGEKLKRLGKYSIHTRLLKGRLYLEKGIHLEASKIFQSIIDSKHADAQLKNEAKFYLGKSLYLQGKMPEALTILRQVKEPVSKNVRAEKQHLYSLILMSQGKYRKAAQYLRKNWWNAPGNWDLYARLNLGVALIHSGDTEAGFNLIKQIGLKDLQGDEAHSLIDKANQSLGYLLLNQDDPKQARSFLEKVRLDSAYSNLALLGAGWASARLEQYNQAIIPWLELQKKDIRDIPVQESMLMVPYAFEQMGRVKKSVRFYQKAIKAYEKEVADLNVSMKALKDGELTAELMKLDVSSEDAWISSVNEAGKSNSLRYVRQLIEDAEVFNLFHNFKEARLLKLNAGKKIKSISDMQLRMLNQAGYEDKAKSKKNRDQIQFIQILAADLLKRSDQLQQDANKNIEKISIQMKARALSLLGERKKRLDLYLVQSRLAMAQSYDKLKSQ